MMWEAKRCVQVYKEGGIPLVWQRIKEYANEVTTMEQKGPGMMQKEYEINALLKKLRTRRLNVIVEIGTAKGGTLREWCRIAGPDALIISIDLPCGIHGGGYPWWKKQYYQTFAEGNQTIRLLREDSHSKKTRGKLEKILDGRKIDFLFIDGDHRYEGVLADFSLYFPLLSRGGIVALHDICKAPSQPDVGVWKLWEELKAKYGKECSEIIADPKQELFGFGIIEPKCNR